MKNKIISIILLIFIAWFGYYAASNPEKLNEELEKNMSKTSKEKETKTTEETLQEILPEVKKPISNSFKNEELNFILDDFYNSKISEGYKDAVKVGIENKSINEDNLYQTLENTGFKIEGNNSSEVSKIEKQKNEYNEKIKLEQIAKEKEFEQKLKCSGLKFDDKIKENWNRYNGQYEINEVFYSPLKNSCIAIVIIKDKIHTHLDYLDQIWLYDILEDNWFYTNNYYTIGEIEKCKESYNRDGWREVIGECEKSFKDWDEKIIELKSENNINKNEDNDFNFEMKQKCSKSNLSLDIGRYVATKFGNNITYDIDQVFYSSSKNTCITDLQVYDSEDYFSKSILLDVISKIELKECKNLFTNFTSCYNTSGKLTEYEVFMKSLK